MAQDGPETLGALLARVRGERGVSQLRVAERLCAASGQSTITRHEVSRWEREERVPTAYWLGWLGAVLDVPLPELEAAAVAARRLRARRPVDESRSRHGAEWIRSEPGVYRRAS